MGTQYLRWKRKFRYHQFLKEFNEAVYSNYEGVQTIAEESTSFPMVSNQLWVVWVLE
jgi:1,4-alpha-glucan branching enzyme